MARIHCIPRLLANNTQEYWNKMFKDWYERIPFDGIWTDMNEVSSFCVGSCGTGRYFDNPVHPPFAVGNSPTQYPLGFDKTNSTEWKSISKSIAATATTAKSTPTSSSSSSSIDSKNTLASGKGNINYPPYAINHAQGDHDLATHAVSPNATHAGGTVEYDIHNLYGFYKKELSEKHCWKFILIKDHSLLDVHHLLDLVNTWVIGEVTTMLTII